MTKINVTVRKIGMTMENAISIAQDYAGPMDHFRVQAFKIGRDWPVASWSTCAGDDIRDIGKFGYTMKDEIIIKRNINSDECDMLKVIDDNTGKTVATILVNG